jgi:signal transduction histidine kinase
VKALVEAHGGTVHVDSAPANGTRVTVVLPALAGPFLSLSSENVPLTVQ